MFLVSLLYLRGVGIVQTLHSVRQIEAVKRPLRDPTEGEYKELMCDLLWSDPTDNDNVQGLFSQPLLIVSYALEMYYLCRSYSYFQ